MNGLIRKTLIAAAAVAVMAPAAAIAQITAEMPFAVEGWARPNVLFFIDNTGDMNSSSGINDPVYKRNRVEIVRDVMAGTLIPLKFDDQHPLYYPHHNRDDDEKDAVTYYPLFKKSSVTGKWIYQPGQHWVGDDLAPVMPKVYRCVQGDQAGQYVPDPNGTFFAFFNEDTDPLPGTPLGDLIDSAMTTFDAYMRQRITYNGFSYIHMAYQDADVYPDDPIVRDVYEAVGDTSQPNSYTYTELLVDYWYYGESVDTSTGDWTLVGGLPSNTLIPVKYQAGDSTVVWSPPAGQGFPATAYGKCLRGGGEWQDCYWPLAASDGLTPAGYFIWYSDLGSVARTAEELSPMDVSVWVAALVDQGVLPEYYCPVTTTRQLLHGDAPYASWRFVRDIRTNKWRLLTDTNSLRYTVYGPCDQTAPGAQPLLTVAASEPNMENEILSGMPYVQMVEKDELETIPGGDPDINVERVDDEFVIHYGAGDTTPLEECEAYGAAGGSTCYRLDEYLRIKLESEITTEYLADAISGDSFSPPPYSLSTPWPPLADTSVLTADPFFGGYFNYLYYDSAYRGMPGIMDVYTDINYGLIRFDNLGLCTKASQQGSTADDFPPDSQDDCVGAVISWNVTSWADFPYYRNLGYSSDNQNKLIQKFIQLTFGKSDFGEDLGVCGDGVCGKGENKISCPLDCASDSGNKPVAAGLHDAYRYYYDHFDDQQTLSGYTGPLDIRYTHDPNDRNSMYFNLGFPNPSASESDHIIQDDPFYVNGCRRNFMILLTAGNQTVGEQEMPSYSYLVATDPDFKCNIEKNADQPACQQAYWITRLKFGKNDKYHPDKGYDTEARERWTVKSFIIGFGIASNDGAQFEVSKSAAASDLDEPYDFKDLTDPTEFYDDPPPGGDNDSPDPYDDPYMAQDEASLRVALAEILGKIMASKVARTAPSLSTATDTTNPLGVDLIAVTNYFDVGGDYPLWKGHIYAKRVPLDGSTPSYYWQYAIPGDSLNAGETVYDAGVLLKTTPADRDIFTTLNGQDPVEFTASALIGTTAEILLNPNNVYGWTTSASDPVNALKYERLINFSRMEMDTPLDLINGATFDGTSTEVQWKLGPMFHSNPRVVGPPQSTEFSEWTGYASFAAAYYNRKDIVYTGTLYGMVEALNLHPDTSWPGRGVTEGGEEMFAFIPMGVLPFLELQHRGIPIYGVDSSFEVTDAYGDFDTDGDDEWRTILISGLGGGGTSYFALDITGDTTQTAPGGSVDVSMDATTGTVKPLWNFGDKQRLGFTWSVPTTVPVIHNTDVKFAALFGGGRRPEFAKEAAPFTNDTFGLPQTVGHHFYAVDLETGDTLKAFYIPAPIQIDGNDLDKRDTDGNADFSMTNDSLNENEMPGTPVAYDPDDDGYYEWVYMADFEGQVWKINMEDPDPAKWKRCLFYDVTDSDADAVRDKIGTSGNPDWRNPIWYTPTLGIAPNGSLIVFFYTGHAEKPDVATETEEVHHMFAVVDNNSVEGCSYGQSMATVTGTSSTILQWPLTFSPGEKPITNILLVGGILIFKTFDPVITKACQPGTIRLYQVDYLTGEIFVVETIDSYSEMVQFGGKVFDTLLLQGGTNDVPELNLLLEGPSQPATPMSWGEGIRH